MRSIALNENEREALAQKARYNAANFARLCGLPSRQLQREFHRQLGCPPQRWLDEQRIRAAKQLLLSGQLIKQVASELGFKQTSHFCRHFKTQNLMTPSQFIRSASSAPGFVAHR
jgi:AraC-like DNA-binding protein